MQPEILIAAAVGIIVSFIFSTWRWSASQNRRFDRVIQEFREDNHKLRSEFREDIGKLRDDNSKLRSEFREDNNKLRSEFREDNSKLREEIKELHKDVSKIDRRLSQQHALIQALWSRIFREDVTTSLPDLQE